MTFSTLVTLIAVWIAAIASPGPDLVQIIRLGSRSREAGIWAALGIMVGNTIWITASLAGLSALINATPDILNILQLAGGAVLVWMGYSGIRGGLATRRRSATVVARSTPAAGGAVAGEKKASISGDMSAWQALRTGIWTNLANPKAVLFFGAVFAQFIRPDMGIGASVLVALVLIVVGVAWFVGVALAVRGLAAKILANSAIIDIVAGVIFLALGGYMVVEGVAGLLG